MDEELRGVLRALGSHLKSAWVFPNLTGKKLVNATSSMNRVFGPAVEPATSSLGKLIDEGPEDYDPWA